MVYITVIEHIESTIKVPDGDFSSAFEMVKKLCESGELDLRGTNHTLKRFYCDSTGAIIEGLENGTFKEESAFKTIADLRK